MGSGERDRVFVGDLIWSLLSRQTEAEAEGRCAEEEAAATEKVEDGIKPR